MITVLHCVESVQATDFFRGLADHHDRARIRMLIAAFGGRSRLHEDLEARGISVWSLETRGKLTWPRTVARLARLVRREQVDVLHLHLFEPTLLGILAGRLAGVRAIVNTRHHADLHEILKKPWHVRLDAWMARRADRVIAVSGQVKEVLTQVEGVPIGAVEVIHPGCDFVGQARSDQAACDAVRRVYGIAPEQLVIGMVARLHPIKGHRILFEALARLDTSVPSWKVLLMGQGSLRQELERQIRELGLESRVVFTGFVEAHQRAACYSVMDVLVHPSFEDAAPMPIIEAMAFGLPVIATPRGHVSSVIEHQRSGWIVPVGQPEPLAAALQKLLNDASLRQTLGAAARQRVASGFRWKDMTRAYEACYDRVLRVAASIETAGDVAASVHADRDASGRSSHTVPVETHS